MSVTRGRACHCCALSKRRCSGERPCKRCISMAATMEEAERMCVELPDRRTKKFVAQRKKQAVGGVKRARPSEGSRAQTAAISAVTTAMMRGVATPSEYDDEGMMASAAAELFDGLVPAPAAKRFAPSKAEGLGITAPILPPYQRASSPVSMADYKTMPSTTSSYWGVRSRGVDPRILPGFVSNISAEESGDPLTADLSETSTNSNILQAGNVTPSFPVPMLPTDDTGSGMGMLAGGMDEMSRLSPVHSLMSGETPPLSSPPLSSPHRTEGSPLSPATSKVEDTQSVVDSCLRQALELSAVPTFQIDFDADTHTLRSCFANTAWTTLFGVSKSEVAEMAARGEIPRYVYSDDIGKYSETSLKTLRSRATSQVLTCRFVGGASRVFTAREASHLEYSAGGAVKRITLLYTETSAQKPVPTAATVGVARSACGGITLAPTATIAVKPPRASLVPLDAELHASIANTMKLLQRQPGGTTTGFQPVTSKLRATDAKPPASSKWDGEYIVDSSATLHALAMAQKPASKLPPLGDFFIPSLDTLAGVKAGSLTPIEADVYANVPLPPMKDLGFGPVDSFLDPMSSWMHI